MTTPLVPRYANTEQVTAAYLRTIVGDYGVGVGSVLPGPSQATGLLPWAVNGFITVSGITDPINPDVPVREATVSLEAWAVAPNSGKAPWGQAFAIAETVIAAGYDTVDTVVTPTAHYVEYNVAAVVDTLPAGFPDVRVFQFYARTGPSRRPNDPSNFARVGFDVSISWHPLG